MHPISDGVSIEEAARFLNVSPAYVLKQIEAGELACRATYPHPVIDRQALTTFKQAVDKQTAAALDDLTALSQELGIGYWPPKFTPLAKEHHMVEGTQGTYRVTVQAADDGSGDVVLPLPDAVQEKLGLHAGDSVTLIKLPNGDISISRLEGHPSKPI